MTFPSSLGEASPFSTNTEREVVIHLASRLRPWFHIRREVWLRHPLKDRPIRIDFVIAPRTSDGPIEFLGIECKRWFGDDGRGFMRALKQGIDYRHASINDRRLPQLQGVRLEFVLIYPCLNMSHAAYWGAARLAGQFNVGVAYDEPGRFAQNGLRFDVSASRLWSSLSGWTDVVGFGSGRTVGAS